jgi:DNA-binding response OmpR family regulator
MNILWVENHQRFSQIAVNSFLAAHVVTVAPSVVAARQCLSETAFDLVMLDYDLDDGKGTELVREIISRPSRPQLIATSSHLFGNQALIDAGADAVCSKMDFANIEQVIADLSSKQ